MEIDFDDSVKSVEVGDGFCGLEHSFPVTLGQLVNVTFTAETFDPYSLGILWGTRSVWFEPS